MNEQQYNNPTFDDPKQCGNPECVEGYIYILGWDFDNECNQTDKEKCPYCDDYGHEL